MKPFFIFLICILLQFSCKTRKQQTFGVNPSKEGIANDLIKDCPEELISNQMPSFGKPNANKANQYYIYKGERKEIKDFDSAWVSKHCKVKISVVQ